MIIMMNAPAADQVRRVQEKIAQFGLESHLLSSPDRIIITAAGDLEAVNPEQFERLPGVERVIPVATPFKLASRQFRGDATEVAVGAARFGGPAVPVIAGPCAVESYDQVRETALAVKAAGAAMLRGGAYKPRTSPYSFQGLEEEGLKILAAVGRETGLPVVSEVTDPRAVELAAAHLDMLQVGARNMQNYVLLKEVARANKPILLKRSPAATVEEWLMAAEYILAGGNPNVVLCERGIRTFETGTRYTLDINAIPLVKLLSHLPVMADPSHGTGKWKLVGPVAKAALAAGADGLMLEVHPCPEEAMSDGSQSLTVNNFRQLMKDLAVLSAALGRGESPATAGGK
ncbi:MAG TPA: 3-deoxy-7-phosphoheptulonate synthase [Selenomonadales bacterium]|nr:3-deoxy-7-phosphoheptulonate synthase [Selenomonadales bacterium]